MTKKRKKIVRKQMPKQETVNEGQDESNPGIPSDHPLLGDVTGANKEQPMTPNTNDLPEYMTTADMLLDDDQPQDEVDNLHVPIITRDPKAHKSQFVSTTGGDAQPNIDSWRREVIRYLEVAKVGKRIDPAKFHLYQKALWVAMYNAIDNTSIEDINALFDAFIEDFTKHKAGIFSPGYIFRCIVDFKSGKTYIDEYAIYLYSLLMVHATKNDTVRANSVVDINKAVSEAPDDIAAKVLAYFNKVGTSAEAVSVPFGSPTS